MKRKFFISVMVCVICITAFAGTIPVFAAESPGGTYALSSAGEYLDTFVNYVDGYQLQVDAGMSVDMSYGGVGAVLESSTKRIEIYKQDISATSTAGYINYSNKFLSNTYDHVTTYNNWVEINDRDVKVTEWYRGKLAKVPNDKNYYICLEIPQGSSVYTVFVKSSVPIESYRYLAEHFSVFAPTAAPYMRSSAAVDLETRGWNDETLAFYLRYFGADSELTWGIFEPDTANFSYNQIDYYRNYFDYDFPIWLNYSEVENTYKHPNLKNRLDAAYAHGAVLELTLQTRAAEGNLVYSILNGNYDAFLYDYAKVIAEHGHPVMFRLFNEMNGDWCPYSSYNTSKDTMVFKEVYQYVYNIFEETGANANTIWVWNPNSVSFPNFDWNHPLMYYPGDDYVDVVGMTAYNTGNYYPGETWREFDALYRGMYYNYCSWFKQPFMITEFASATAGGNKARWIENMFSSIDEFERIKVAIWWDGCDWDAHGNIARSYFLDETPDVMQAFKKGLAGLWHLDVYA